MIVVPQQNNVLGNVLDINLNSCYQWEVLQQKFTTGITFKELRSIALILEEMIPNLTKMDRPTKRSFPLLLKWFISNWSLIEMYLPYIHLVDDNFNVINGVSQIQSLQYKHSK